MPYKINPFTGGLDYTAVSSSGSVGGAGVANDVVVWSEANTISNIAKANNAVLVTSGAGVPSMATDIPTAVTIGAAYIHRVGGTDVAVADGGTGASDAATARTNLGLGSISTQAANNVAITGGTITGITDVAVADGGTGASDAATARGNLSAAASGANSDITSLSGITGSIGTADYADFDIAAGAPTHQEGRVFYVAGEDHTLAYYNDEADITHNIGQEFWVRARNTTGVTITNGQVVYISGATGQIPTIALAKADSVTTSSVIGVATHDIENNTNGYVTSAGIVRDINTSSFSDGDTVYLSAATAGTITTTAPSPPNSRVQVGVIARAHATMGKLYVAIDNQSVTASSVTPAGSDTQVQFNDGGALGADAGLTFNKTTDVLTVGGLVRTGFINGGILFSSAAGLTQDSGNLFWDDANNEMGIGTSTTNGFRVRILDSGNSGLAVESTAALGANSGAGIQGRSTNNPSAANQRLGFYTIGSSGANSLNSVAMIGWSGEAWTGSAKGSYFTIETTNLGATARTEKVRVTADGNVLIGTTTDDGHKLHVAGEIHSTGTVVADTPIVVSSGGTGAGTHIAYALLAGGTTATGALQSLSLGTAGQILQSNGAGVLPSWVDASGGAVDGSGVAARVAYWLDTDTLTSHASFTASGGTVTVGSSTLAGFFTVKNTGGNNILEVDASAGTIKSTGLTASRALASNASQQLVSSATTDTELGYLSGVTSAIQTQINGKVSGSGTTGKIPKFTPSGTALGDSVLNDDGTNIYTSGNLGVGSSTSGIGSFDQTLLIDAGSSGDVNAALEIRGNRTSGGGVGAFGAINGYHGTSSTSPASVSFNRGNADDAGRVILVTKPTGGLRFESLICAEDGNTYLGYENSSGGSFPVPLAGYRLDINGTVRTKGDVTIADAKNIILSGTTGTKIGTATTQKLGFYNATPVVQPAALTAQLTTITHTEPGTPDYAFADATNVSPWGFTTQDEANSLLKVVANLQVRLAEVEARWESLGLVAAN